MKPLGLVGLGLIVALFLQWSAASQTGSDAVVSVSADGNAWAPSGQSIAYSDGAQLVVMNLENNDVLERCRVAVVGLTPPIHAIQWSPDEAQIALAGTRVSDGWKTIWVTTPNCSEPRDILPPGAGPGSPGNRALALSTWKDARTIAFLHYCGPGCLNLSTISVDDASLGRFCSAEGEFSWNRAKTHAVAPLHLGGLAVVATDAASPDTAEIRNCAPMVEGCDVVQGDMTGTMYHFEAWAPDDEHGLVTRNSCDQDQDPDLQLWDTRTGGFTPVAKSATRGSMSPDGKRIAFIALKRANTEKTAVGSSSSSRMSAVIANATDYQVEKIVPLGTFGVSEGPFDRLEHRPGDFRPSWSPDGRYLLVKHAKRNISVLDADTGSEVLTFGDVSADWAPTGRRLALIDQASRTLRVVDIP